MSHFIGVGSLPWFNFRSNRIQQRLVFLAERRVQQQIRPVGQGLAQLLLAAPAANPGVVAIEQRLRHAQAAKLRRAGVVGIVEQASRAVLRARDAILGRGNLGVGYAEALKLPRSLVSSTPGSKRIVASTTTAAASSPPLST